VQVEPLSQLELKTGAWNPAQRLYMNAIGKVRLVFDEAAIFDPYEQNRSTGSFILIDPETNNTVAGGMMAGKRAEISGLHSGEARVILSLPADLADQIMASELFASRRHEAEVRRMTAAEAADLWASAASDI
jgi:sulfate adenylyltransferase subunit 1